MRTYYEDMPIEQMRSLVIIAGINYRKSYSETYREICLEQVTLMVQEMKNRRVLNAKENRE